MGTFLTTRKMAPALAARIEASVRGRRGKAAGASGRARSALRLVSVLRLGVPLAIAAVVCWLLVLRHQDRQALEAARAALLDTLRAQSASLTDGDRGSLSRIESWLLRFAAPYEGDLVASELRAPRGLADLVARPAVYVRGPVEDFGGAARIAQAASASPKDAFLLCMVDPPASRAEKVLLGKVRAAHTGGAAVEQRTQQIRRLYEEQLGMRVLEPAWEQRVLGARDLRELSRLRAELERAPVEKAKAAARSGLLIVALDEQGDKGGFTDIDGERAHWVRVGIIDLASARFLLRLRKHVDPSAWSTVARSEYSSGLDGCALALDVQESALTAR